MADTTYTSGVTVITSDTMNDLNRLHYTILGDPADIAAVRTAIGALVSGGALGTPSSGVLTNCTGTASGLTAGTANAVAVGGITGLGTGVSTFLATPSSANLRSALTDETGSGAAVFATAPTIASPVLTGTVDLSSASSGQVKFPATQNASSDVNTLDDYEEGTWTPVLYSSSGSGITFGAQWGQYVKIGRLVYIFADVIITGKGTASGDINLSGLPFSVSSSHPSGASKMPVIVTATSGTNYPVAMRMIDGTTTAITAVGFDGTDAQWSNVSASSRFFINCAYTSA